MQLVTHLRAKPLELAFIAIFLLAAVAYTSSIDLGVARSPDSVSERWFSEHYADDGRLAIPHPAVEAGGEGVHPRQMQVLDGALVTEKFLGFTFLAGTFGAVEPSFIDVIVPVTGAMAGLFVVVLARAITSTRPAIAAGCVALVSPPLWFWATTPLTASVPAAMFLVGAAALIIRGYAARNVTVMLIVLAFGMIGAAFTLRPDAILLVAPFLIAMAIDWLRRGFRGNLRNFIAMAAGFIPLIPFFYANWSLFGHPLRTGQHLRLGWESTAPPLTQKTFSFIIPNLADLSSSFPVAVLPLVAAIALIACPSLARGTAPMIRTLAVCAIVASAIFAVMFLTINLPGTSRFSVDRAYPRQFLAVFLFGIPFVICILRHLGRRGPLVASPVALFLVAFAVAASNVVLPELLQDHQDQESQLVVMELILSETEPNAVIILAHNDYFIFPNRMVIVPVGIAADDRGPVVAESARLLLDDGYPVFWHRTSFFDESYDMAMEVEGLRAEQVNPGDSRLWRIQANLEDDGL